MAARTRTLVAAVLLVLTALLTPLADAGLWIRRDLVNTKSFVAMADDLLANDAVRSGLARALVKRAEKYEPALRIGESPLTSAVDEVLQSSAFTSIFDTALRQLHDQLVRGDDTLTLSLGDVYVLIHNEVEQRAPQLADFVPTNRSIGTITVARYDDRPVLWNTIEVAYRVSLWAPVALLAAFAGAVVVARRRWFTLGIGSFAVGLGGVALLAGMPPARRLVGNRVADLVDRGAFVNAWGIVGHGVVRQTIVLIVTAAVAGVVALTLNLTTRQV